MGGILLFQEAASSLHFQHKAGSWSQFSWDQHTLKTSPAVPCLALCAGVGLGSQGCFLLLLLSGRELWQHWSPISPQSSWDPRSRQGSAGDEKEIPAL